MSKYENAMKLMEERCGNIRERLKIPAGFMKPEAALRGINRY